MNLLLFVIVILGVLDGALSMFALKMLFKSKNEIAQPAVRLIAR